VDERQRVRNIDSSSSGLHDRVLLVLLSTSRRLFPTKSNKIIGALVRRIRERFGRVRMVIFFK
jgi:hypothetical protein